MGSAECMAVRDQVIANRFQDPNNPGASFYDNSKLTHGEWVLGKIPFRIYKLTPIPALRKRGVP